MAVSVAIWSQDLEPNKRNVYTVENDIRISGASLAAELADNNGRTVVEVVIKIPEEYDIDDLPVDEETGERPPMHKFVLCALTAGKVEQQPLDLVLPEGEEIEFVVKGKNRIHLYGNYIQQNPDDDDDEDDEDSDEDEFDLESVPSDVEVDLEDAELDSGRFEEVAEEPAPKSAKRAREDEDMADVSIASAADTSVTLSKKEKKRAKKLKNEAGKAAPAPTTPTTAEATTPNGKDKKDKPVEKKETKPAEKKEGGKKDGEKKKKSEPKTLPGGVTIEDKTIGNGQAAKAGKKIGMRYIGRLKNGKVFDSNTKGKPFTFTLGAGDVIKGWDEGIPGMQVGGERVLTIPANKAYGKRGAPPDIPPNSELIFEVKLVQVN